MNKKSIFLELEIHRKLKIFSAISGEQLNVFVNQAVQIHLEKEIKKRNIVIKDGLLNEKSSEAIN
ncbi:MAG: hypothetical protein M0P61_01990 [Ignavibacteriaceae bacterium]|jgi:hypothetical protein|nr:hypothetical protein [Ignavibacteriaceae bacterium]